MIKQTLSILTNSTDQFYFNYSADSKYPEISSEEAPLILIIDSKSRDHSDSEIQF